MIFKRNKLMIKKIVLKNKLLTAIIVSAAVMVLAGIIVSSAKGNPIEKLMLFFRDGFSVEDGDGSPDDGFPDDITDDGTEPDETTSNGGTDTLPPDETTSPSEDTTAPPIIIPPDPETYFNDALFIGDSRTVGLYSYGRIDGAKYFARTSMNVSNCFADKKSETGTGSLNLEEYLAENSFGKIYILLGINEIGYSYDWIVSRYGKLLDRLTDLQPDAMIIIQSNMHVTKSKSDSNPDTFSNKRINALNSRLKKLAEQKSDEGKKVYYLGFEAIFDDENGNMKKEYTGDGVHLRANSYNIWKDYLTADGMIPTVVYPSDTQEKPPVTAEGDETTSAEAVTPPETTKPETTKPETTKPETTKPDTTKPETTAPETTAPETTSSDTTAPETTAPDSTTDPETLPPPDILDNEYFSDALFIGDSRTVGLYSHGRIDGAKYFARTSMTVGNCFSGSKSETGTGSIDLEEYLTENKFGKIYILLGINEIGYSYSWIVSRYESMIERISELQPDAKIIIQSNMHVTKAKSDANPDTFSNVRIDTLNKKLAELADGERVFYFGFESIFDGDNGALKSEYSRDGVHFAKAGYILWKEHLFNNGRF